MQGSAPHKGLLWNWDSPLYILSHPSIHKNPLPGGFLCFIQVFMALPRLSPWESWRAAPERALVNFLYSAWLLRGIAYNKDGKCGSQYVIDTPKRKRPPPGAAISERGSFLVLTALQPSVKPLTNVVRSYICSDGQDKCGNIRHWATPPFP